MRVSGHRIHAWDGTLHWDTFDVPEPSVGAVQLAVEACGIGRTVVHYTSGSLTENPDHLPRVPGHELVGVVRAIGPDVDPSLTGRRVMAYFYLICGRCSSCVGGAEPRCGNLAGRVGVHSDGGYAPMVNLPVRNLVAVPDGIDPIAATAIPDAIATPVHIGRRAAIGAADRVVVIGAGGGVGIHMVQVAAARGADVQGYDIGGRKAETIARYVTAVDVSGGLPEPDDAHRPTVVVDFAGQPETLKWGFNTLAPGGRMAILASFDHIDMTIAPRRLVLAELTVMGSLYANRSELAEAADMVQSGAVEAVVTEVVPATGVPAVHARVRRGELVGRAALDWRRSAG